MRMVVMITYRLLASIDKAYTRWSCHNGMSTPPAPSNEGPITVFGEASHADPLAGWYCSSKKRAMSEKYTQTSLDLRYLPQTNTGRKQISIRCNRIEHWVHLGCEGIRLAQYTDSWTCHQHKESRLTKTRT